VAEKGKEKMKKDIAKTGRCVGATYGDRGTSRKEMKGNFDPNAQKETKIEKKRRRRKNCLTTRCGLECDAARRN